jgi:phosphoribosylanthranilate isomerase
MSTVVKICGITSVEDGLAAAAAGADAIGLMLYDGSPRHITLETAVEISRALPPFVSRVGVFVNADSGIVAEAISVCGLNILQFHGDETPEYCRQFPVMTMKAFRMRDRESLKKLKEFTTDAWLLDAYVKDARGGTGASFNWDLAIEAKELGRPIFLAGGLTPDNIGEAVRKVRPYGVDVSSGVEVSPGKKDHAKVRAFIKAAKEAAA